MAITTTIERWTIALRTAVTNAGGTPLSQGSENEMQYIAALLEQLATTVVGTTDARIVDTVLTLTDGATINWDASTRRAKVTLGGNRTLANPTNLTAGGVYVLEVIQDGTGGRSLAFGSTFAESLGIRTEASAKSVLAWQYDGSKLVALNRPFDAQTDPITAALFYGGL